MNAAPPDPIAVRARAWLTSHAVPLWLERGFDKRRGYFHEALNADLTPVDGPVRTMVQARQIYSFRVALDLDLCAMEVAARVVTEGTRFLIDHCRNEDGTFAHAVQPGLGITRRTPELYTQAFALFGLANAYALAPMPEYRRRALDLTRVLKAHRAGASGGFTELDADGRVVFRSNPLMHLFEAAVYWAEIDPTEDAWRTLATDLAALARTRLIDPPTGVIAEEFDADWTPSRTDGRFYFEPGHQYEWAWLLGRFDRLSGNVRADHDDGLYALAARHGLHQGRVIDQVWSDFAPKSLSARFWPQAERAKAAVQRGDHAAAAEAMGALSLYLDVPRPGLWCDQIDEAGRPGHGPAKASSLYHIIGAMAEYLGAAAGPGPTLERRG